MKFSRPLVLSAVALFLITPWSARADDATVFGNRETTQGLLGIIYDLKQTPKRTPTGVDPQTYPGIIENFLTKNWDETVLNPYFRSARALHTTQVYIPMMGADQAPKAFNMEGVIKPSCWAIHYKGQVSPPETGVYRFVGGADDFIAVAINDKTVLFQTWWHVEHPFWTAKQPPVINGQHSPMVSGDWISMRKDEPVDLDIMIGEWPGGQFQAILLYQKQGASYPSDGHGNLVLPIFQLAHYDTQTPSYENGPPFLKGAQAWKSYP